MVPNTKGTTVSQKYISVILWNRYSNKDRYLILKIQTCNHESVSLTDWSSKSSSSMTCDQATRIYTWMSRPVHDWSPNHFHKITALAIVEIHERCSSLVWISSFSEGCHAILTFYVFTHIVSSARNSLTPPSLYHLLSLLIFISWNLSQVTKPKSHQVHGAFGSIWTNQLSHISLYCLDHITIFRM